MRKEWDKMSALQEFLNRCPMAGMICELTAPERLRKALGEQAKFEARILSADDYRRVFRGDESNDKMSIAVRVLAMQCVNPDFKSAADIEAAGCRTPEEYVKKSLSAGEIGALAGELLSCSGFSAEAAHSMRQEAKN